MEDQVNGLAGAAGPPILLGEHDWLDSEEMRLRSAFGWMLLSGVAAWFAGTLLLLVPNVSIAWITVVAGAHFLAAGAVRCFMGLRDRGEGRLWLWQLLIGAIVATGGLVVLGLASESLNQVAMVSGMVLLGCGVGDLTTGLTFRDSVRSWWVIALTGVSTVIAGAIVMSWPDPDLRFVAVVIGVDLIAVGSSGLIVGWSMGRRLDRLAEGRPSSSGQRTGKLIDEAIIDLREGQRVSRDGDRQSS